MDSLWPSKSEWYELVRKLFRQMNIQSLFSHFQHLEQTSLVFILVTWFLNFVHLLFNFLIFV
jgi:hypothetical protein